MATKIRVSSIILSHHTFNLEWMKRSRRHAKTTNSVPYIKAKRANQDKVNQKKIPKRTHIKKKDQKFVNYDPLSDSAIPNQAALVIANNVEEEGSTNYISILSIILHSKYTKKMGFSTVLASWEDSC